jgi:nitric oxide dioxygenase
MTPDQIEKIQASFAKVVPIAPAAAALFYDRLFTIAPEVRPMFKSNMVEQGKKLMASLGVIVRGLKTPETLIPMAQTMAVRHLAYGVRPEDYPKVGAALIWTLERGLKDDFTPDVREAWIAAYGILSSAMIAAAYPVEQAQRKAG